MQFSPRRINISFENRYKMLWLKSISLLSALMLLLNTVQGKQNRFCQISKLNTMCKFPPGSGCKKIKSGKGITQDIRKLILRTHNNFRQNQKASNMRQMIWNNGLAKVAQRWADQCIYDHDKNRSTPKFRGHVGQNVAIFSGYPNMDFKKVIKAWYNEKTNYKFGNRFVFSKETGHYTQIVWADTYAIGCGYARYMKSDGLTHLYVCNYGPGGNLHDALMYRKGKACSQCPNKKCSKKYPKLCAPR